jgi:hypothetical protein
VILPSLRGCRESDEGERDERGELVRRRAEVEEICGVLVNYGPKVERSKWALQAPSIVYGPDEVL